MKSQTRERSHDNGVKSAKASTCVSRCGQATASGIQRAVGNRAAQRLMTVPGRIQRKATLGAADDAFEREADAVADRIVGMAPAAVNRAGAPSIQRKCVACEQEEPVIQAQRVGTARVSSSAVDTAAGVASRGGQPLGSDVRAFMEPRFGRDFADVRVHTDGDAARAAQGIHARAYTLGRHIVFGAGEYAPHTTSGMRLLAHELTHSVQQAPGGDARIRRAPCGHDSLSGPGCGASSGRWELVESATEAVTNVALDHLIVTQGLALNLGGQWAPQVQTPPNPEKTGIERGFADGVKVQLSGSALRVEIVEVKSRSTRFGGGCARASREARGYVRVLNAIASEIVSVSQSATARGFGGGRIGRDIGESLRSEGVDLSNPATRAAWNFYQSLQARLGSRFSTPLTSVTFDVNRDGAPATDYRAGPPVAVPCVRRGRPGVKARQLLFQVSGDGGVSYRCDDTPCSQTEEEEQRQRQTQPATEAQPRVAEPDAPRAQRPNDMPADDEDSPAERPQQQPAPGERGIPVMPVLVPVAATAAGIAYARHRARQLAMRRAALEAARRAAARRAAQQAWVRAAQARVRQRALQRAGSRAVGKAAARAVIYAEVAAAVIVLASGRAEARVGPGDSALESLYRVMTTNGTPPSPEMRNLLESDPVLRDLAERAAGGDPTPLQEEATRRMLELARDNPDQFSPEDLETLLEVSRNASGSAGVPPQTVEELQRAIDAARAGRPSRTGPSAPTPAPPGTAPTPTGPSSSTPNTTGTSPPTPAPTSPPTPAEEYPSLSAESRRRLGEAPTEVRRLFTAMTRQRGGGPRVDDDAVTRFLATAPANLTATEVNQLIERLRPAEGESLDAILGRLRRAIEQIRSANATPRGEAPDDGGTHAEGTPDGGVPDGGGQRGGTTPREARPSDPAPARDEYVRRMQERIRSYGGWDSIARGSLLLTAGGDADFTTAQLNRDRIPVTILCRNAHGVRIAASTSAVITRRTSQTVDVRLPDGATFVTESGETVAIDAGTLIRNSRLIGGRRR